MICHSNIKKAHRFQKWCNDREIFIFPIPTTVRHEYNICVERNGKQSKGSMIFKNVSDSDVPNVWNQIRTLYQLIYEKECLTQ